MRGTIEICEVVRLSGLVNIMENGESDAREGIPENIGL